MSDNASDSTVIGQPNPAWLPALEDDERCGLCGGWECTLDCPSRDVHRPERPRI